MPDTTFIGGIGGSLNRSRDFSILLAGWLQIICGSMGVVVFGFGDVGLSESASGMVLIFPVISIVLGIFVIRRISLAILGSIAFQLMQVVHFNWDSVLKYEMSSGLSLVWWVQVDSASGGQEIGINIVSLVIVMFLISGL